MDSKEHTMKINRSIQPRVWRQIAIYSFLLIVLLGVMITYTTEPMQWWTGGIVSLMVVIRIFTLAFSGKMQLFISDKEIYFKKSDYSFYIKRSNIYRIAHQAESIKMLHGSSFSEELVAADFSPEEWEQIKDLLPVLVQTETEV